MSESNGKRGELKLTADGLATDTAEDGYRVAELILKSGMAPRGFKTPAQVLVAISYGRELGFKPVQSLSMIAVVEGKPALHSDGIPALVFRSGLLESMEIEEGGDNDDFSDAYCLVTVKRKGVGGHFFGQFCAADAKRAGLWGKDNWKKYPRRMLLNRARTFALRDGFPDVLLGAVTADEVPPESPAFESGAVQPPSDLDALMDASAAEPIATRDVEDVVGEPASETEEERAEREEFERERNTAGLF